MGRFSWKGPPDRYQNLNGSFVPLPGGDNVWVRGIDPRIAPRRETLSAGNPAAHGYHEEQPRPTSPAAATDPP